MSLYAGVGLVFPGRFQKFKRNRFYNLKENLRGILFILLVMEGFAIEDGVIKNLINMLPVCEILILTGIFKGFGFCHSRKDTERGLVLKHM